MSLKSAAYPKVPGGPLDVDKKFYTAVVEAPRVPVETIEVPIRSGRAWTVPAGHLVKISTPEGPQVGDLNIWSASNPRERLWASRTRQLQASHVTTFDRLWSTLPYLRPLVTIVGDSLNYGTDADGGRVHDLLGTRCDPYINQLLTGESFDHHCHSNLVRAVLPYGLNEADVHDVLNVFQLTGLNEEDRYFMKACPAKPADYFEMFTEQDCLMALSTCPGGDLSIRMWDESSSAPPEGDPTLAVCRPLKVEIFKIDDAALLGQWKGPAKPAYENYRGGHGLKINKPAWE